MQQAHTETQVYLLQGTAAHHHETIAGTQDVVGRMMVEPVHCPRSVSAVQVFFVPECQETWQMTPQSLQPQPTEAKGEVQGEHKEVQVEQSPSALQT